MKLELSTEIEFDEKVLLESKTCITRKPLKSIELKQKGVQHSQYTFEDYEKRLEKRRNQIRS